MRYAVYVTPPEHDPLARCAAEWLGRDAFSGKDHPAPTGLPEELWRTLTADPRRYGFHATLKAPFSLAQGRSEADLIAAFEAFCAQTAAVEIPRLVLSRLGAFFALVPDGDAADVNRLCASAVEAFEPFRAPLSPDDIARRKPERLTERQRSLLEDWGYPYVFEEFRFHMTLTGPVLPEAQGEMQAALEERFGMFSGRPLRIGHLALFREQERGRPFDILAFNALTG